MRFDSQYMNTILIPFLHLQFLCHFADVNVKNFLTCGDAIKISSPLPPPPPRLILPLLPFKGAVVTKFYDHVPRTVPLGPKAINSWHKSIH